MNAQTAFRVADTLYKLKFDEDESRRRAYRVADEMSLTEPTLSVAVKSFIKNWKEVN